MDHDALRLIHETAITASDKRRFQVDDNFQVVITKDNEKITSLEGYAPLRNRFRGSLSTNVLSELVSYTKKRQKIISEAPDQKTFDTIISGFINASSLSAKMFFNLGDVEYPGHADDTANLSMIPLAAYAALNKINGQRLEQREAAEWMEEWNSYLGATGAGGSYISISNAINSIRKIKITEKRETETQARNLGHTKTALEEIDAKNDDGLPEFLSFQCTPYLGFAVREFRLRVSIITSKDSPQIIFRILGKEQSDEDLGIEFKEKLFTELEGIADLTIGTFTP